MKDMILRLKEFIENEARSCSMDYGCVTLIYMFIVCGAGMCLIET